MQIRPLGRPVIEAFKTYAAALAEVETGYVVTGDDMIVPASVPGVDYLHGFLMEVHRPTRGRRVRDLRDLPVRAQSGARADNRMILRAGPPSSRSGGCMTQEGVLGPGAAVRTYSARGSVMMFKAVGDQDDGDFSLMERTLPPGGRRPPAHRHTNCSEAYFVLDGDVSVVVEDEEHLLRAESFLLVPRGTAHTFGNGGSAPARLLVLHAPAMDGYFAQLHELWHRDAPPTPDEERELMSRFGMRAVR